MELTLIQRAEQAEQAAAGDEFRIISEAALAIFGWQDERYTRVLRLLEAGASLDAALTLVPEGMREDRYYLAIEQVWYETAGWEARFDTPGDECGNGDTILAKANTPALALCAAALRARAAGESA